MQIEQRYVLVPVEPTAAMIAAAHELRRDASPALVWEEMIAARPAVGEDVVERVLAKVHAVEKVNIMGRHEVTLYFGDDDEAQKNMEAFVSAAIAAMGSADMGKGGEG